MPLLYTIRLTLSLKLHPLIYVACSIKCIDLADSRSMIKKELVMLCCLRYYSTHDPEPAAVVPWHIAITTGTDTILTYFFSVSSHILARR